MNKDQVAFLALIVSLIALFWQPVKHQLDGARVRVRLAAGLLYPVNGILSRSALGWPSLAKWTEDAQGWSVEVAVLEVENPGRIGITIANPSIDFGRMRWWRRGRRSVAPRLLDVVHDASTESVVRLEPFDKVMFVFDIWPHLQGESQAMPKRPFTLRASVRVAGKRRATLSPYRRRWRILPGAATFLPDPPSAKMVAYRALWRHILTLNKDCELNCLPLSANEINDRFPLTGRAPTKDEIYEILERHHLGDKPVPGHGLISYYAALNLQHHYGAGEQAS